MLAMTSAKQEALQATTTPSSLDNGVTKVANNPRTIVGPASGTASMLAGIALSDNCDPSATSNGNTANWAAIVTAKI